MFPLEKPPQQTELIFELTWQKSLAGIWLTKEKYLVWKTEGKTQLIL
jgi:hypothetical protein